jgi:hypothetical protein
MRIVYKSGSEGRLKPDHEVMDKWREKVLRMSASECEGVIQRMKARNQGEWNVNTRAVYGLLRERQRWWREQAGIRYGLLQHEADRRAQELIDEIGKERAREEEVLLSPAEREEAKERREKAGRNGALGGQPRWTDDLARRREWGRQQRLRKEEQTRAGWL